MTMDLRKGITAGLAAVSVIGSSVFVGGAAEAATGNPYCDYSYTYLVGTGEICLYYHQNLTGAIMDRSYDQGPVADLNSEHFHASNRIQPTDGAGKAVRNRAASAENGQSGYSVYVYYYTNYSGPADFVGSLHSVNLVNTRNNDASYRWTE